MYGYLCERYKKVPSLLGYTSHWCRIICLSNDLSVTQCYIRHLNCWRTEFTHLSSGPGPVPLVVNSEGKMEKLNRSRLWPLLYTKQICRKIKEKHVLYKSIYIYIYNLKREKCKGGYEKETTGYTWIERRRGYAVFIPHTPAPPISRSAHVSAPFLDKRQSCPEHILNEGSPKPRPLYNIDSRYSSMSLVPLLTRVPTR